MAGAFTRSFAAAREALTRVLSEGAVATEVAEGLWSVSRLLEGNAGLRRAVADSSREGQDKAALVAHLVGGKVSGGAQAVTEAVARLRWSANADVPRALEYLAVEALLTEAQSQGRLGQVEDELFRFDRIVLGDQELRSALVDPRADASAKRELVSRLLDHKVAPETVRLVKQAVASPRSRRFDRAIEGYLSIAEVMQEQLAATVTSAVPLDDAQLRRLTDTLTAQYGRQVHANLVVDPQVVGGIRVEIGDEVIDGTISNRLDEARRRLIS